MTSISSSSTVMARTALAGNPSDAHGGAVVSTVVSSVSATVRASPAAAFSFPGSNQQHATSAEVADSALRHAADGDDGGDQPLIQAALTALHSVFDANTTPCTFTLSSTIPRSVGLAGSSAIVIAALKATVDLHPTTAWARRLIGRPEVLASLALHAERDVLGISAGLQDRVVQAFGGTVAMEFGPDAMHTVDTLSVGTYRRLAQALPDCFIACRPDAATNSGAVHAAIDPTDPVVRAAMQRAGDAGRRGAAAVERGDTLGLAAAMNDTFDARASVMSLDLAHVEMVDVARRHGAAANYTGSGGAVVVLSPDPAARSALIELGCTVLEL